MSTLDIIFLVYAVITLVLIWRYTLMANRLRAAALVQRGIKSSFAPLLPKILKDALLFPLYILWHGLEAWIKDLED